MDDRLEYIGGSDIVKLMGVSEYGTWRDVWDRFKTGTRVDLDPEEKRDLLRGQVIEPECERYIRAYVDPTINDYDAFERHHCIREDLEFLHHNDFDGGNSYIVRPEERPVRFQVFAQDTLQPYLRGHIDGVARDTIYEMKAPRSHNVERMSTYGVKPEYVVQCLFYMMITGKPRGYVAVWDVDAWQPILFPVRRDEHMYAQMRAVTRNFWDALTSGAEEPDLYWQRKMGYEHLFDMDELETVVKAFYEAREERGRREKEESNLKPLIMSAVHGVWPEGEKTCQFLVKDYTVRATEAQRLDTTYVTLTVKKRDANA